MSWFKKKDVKPEENLNELPELPELPPLTEFSANKNELPTLPIFPSSPIGEKISNEVVKQTIREPLLEEELPIKTEMPVKKLTREVEEEKPAKTRNIGKMQKQLKEIEQEEPVLYPYPITRQAKEIEQEEPVSYPYSSQKQTKNIEPIFIRIDKYQDAIADLRGAKKAILEIESHLRDVKEIRAREEAELQRWENEIKEAKEKLEEIDAKVFQKLE